MPAFGIECEVYCCDANVRNGPRLCQISGDRSRSYSVTMPLTKIVTNSLAVSLNSNGNLPIGGANIMKLAANEHFW
jgi:hypothetical protein